MRRRALRNFNEIRAKFRPAQISQNEPETPHEPLPVPSAAKPKSPEQPRFIDDKSAFLQNEPEPHVQIDGDLGLAADGTGSG